MKRPDLAATVSFGEAAAIGRIERALFGGDQRLVRLGRYEIIDVVGEGAFGKVYRARDPQLGRTIALKVLEALPARGDVLAEARVMATIGHPNVVAIHDAGVVPAERDDAPPRVFLAMELVDGDTLAGWLAQPRSLAQRLDVLRQCGRGLAAAHAAGIVHGDFKPANALVGRDGRVRVVDFNLARPAVPDDGAAALASTVAGTPAYMAPELWRGEAPSERSDQFALCATAWEVVFGARAFDAASLEALRAQIAEGAAPSPPRRPAVPARVARAIARGLARDPAARHASIAAVVAALEPRRSRAIAIGVALATAALGVGIGAIATGGPRAPAACPRATSELAGVWDPARKDAIAAAFSTAGAPAAAFARVSGALDRATTGWLDAHTAACEATHVRHTQSAILLDRRMACLADWRRQLVALTGQLARATPTLVSQAPRAIGELPPLARCASLAELEAGPARPADRARAAQVDALSDRLAAVRVRYFLGESAAALDEAAAIAREAAAIGWAPVQIGAALWQSDALIAVGRYAEGQAAARTCFDLALAHRDHRSAALAAAVLAFAGAFDASLHEEALRWVRTGESLRAQLEDSTEIEAKLAHVEGNVLVTAAQPAAARVALERAVAAWRRLGDDEHPNLVSSLAMLGVAELDTGATDAALLHLSDAVRLSERDLGPDHPEHAAALINLGLVALARGLYADAGAAFDRGLAIQQRALGPDHPLVAYTQLDRGQLAVALGDRAAADRAFAEAARIAGATLGPQHAVSVVIELATGEHHARTGRGDLARANAERVRAQLTEGDVGPRALAEATLALAELARGDRAAAIAAAERALAAEAEAPDMSGPQRAIALDLAGEALLGAGRTAAGRAALTRAAAETSGPPDPVRRARIAAALAR